MCKELFLIIEVDGITHSYEKVAIEDIKRQTDLEEAGFTVIRFTDEEVLNSINSVYKEIEGCVSTIMKEKRFSPKVRKRKT